MSFYLFALMVNRLLIIVHVDNITVKDPDMTDQEAYILV